LLTCGGAATTLVLSAAEPRLFALVFFAAFFVGFLEAFFATAFLRALLGFFGQTLAALLRRSLADARSALGLLRFRSLTAFS